jgi:ribosomal protein S27AE
VVTYFIVVSVLLLILFIWMILKERQYPGVSRPEMICPHCQTKGLVFTKPILKKTGVSGGKATAAVLTGGVSLLATGLSRKEAVTQAHCGKCGATWSF